MGSSPDKLSFLIAFVVSCKKTKTGRFNETTNIHVVYFVYRLGIRKEVEESATYFPVLTCKMYHGNAPDFLFFLFFFI